METKILTITLRKEVATEEEGKALYNIVKLKLEDKPDVQLSAQITNHIDLDNG